MSYTSRYDRGDWIADCDVCGRKFKASQLLQRWDGLMCCEDDWEIRQPQDFVRGVADTQIAPWLRPEPSDSFIPITLAQLLVPWAIDSNTSITKTFFPRPPPSRNTVNGDALNTQILG